LISIEVLEQAMAGVESDLQARIEKGTLNGLKALALMAQGDAQRRVLKGPKTGRWYGRHRASAPGEAPANDTGFLAGSIKIEVTEKLQVDLRALAPYAIHLEYGTVNMRPRPFLRVSAAEVGKQAPQVIDAYVAEALK
jgi:hypothetical protein